MIANFFWAGSELSYYEQICLKSFLKRGFEVRLHSFDLTIEVPEGVRVIDAAVTAEPDEAHRYTQAGIEKSKTSFSNFFRYRLLAKEPGWWFDTDMFCCADRSRFEEVERRSPGLVAGFETLKGVNNAVLFVSDCRIATELVALAETKARAQNNTFQWGAVGPRLVTRYAKTFPERCLLLPIETFYPVGSYEVKRLFHPDGADYCRSRAAGSLTVHWWNSVLTRWLHIPKNMAPCEGSYIAELFSSIDIAGTIPRLSVDTLEALLEVPQGRWERRIARAVRRTKEFILKYRMRSS